MKKIFGFITALILAVVLRYTNLDLFLVGWFSCMVVWFYGWIVRIVVWFYGLIVIWLYSCMVKSDNRTIRRSIRLLDDRFDTTVFQILLQKFSA